MSNKKDNQIKFLENPGVWIYTFVVKKYPNLAFPVFLIIVVVSALFWYYGDSFKYKSDNDKELMKPTSQIQGIAVENSIEQRVNEEKVNNKCGGASFDILDDLSVVGGERFIFPSKNDEYIASVSGELYQGSRKTTWSCRFPFTATISIVPKGNKSIGLFFDVEGINKLIIGDGDMKSIKVQKNDVGEMGEWNKFYRKYLDKPIVKDRELKITNRQKIDNGMIKFEIELFQAGWEKPILIDDIPLFKPESVILDKNMEVKFRIGINDWLHKGSGSNIRLQTFSIKEEEW